MDKIKEEQLKKIAKQTKNEDLKKSIKEKIVKQTKPFTK